MASNQPPNDRVSLTHKSKPAGKAAKQRGRGDNSANNSQVHKKLTLQCCISLCTIL